MITANNQVYFFADQHHLISYNTELNKFNMKLIKILESDEK